MKPKCLVAVLALAGCGLAAHAQSMKPGLWEINNKMGGSPKMDQAMAQMQQQMASMPPEQRKMVQDMMAKNGVAMGSGGGGGGMSIKTCISKEMAERNEMPSQQHGDCKTTTSERTSSGMKVAYTCTTPPSSGEGQITFTSNEAYTMKMVTKTMVNGKPESTTLDTAGKWLGSDCGSLKPIQAPK